MTAMPIPGGLRRVIGISSRVLAIHPSHHDNFSRSFDKPYHFNLGTNFPALRREIEASASGAELILFEFFETLRL